MQGNTMVIDHPSSIDCSLQVSIALVIVELKPQSFHAVYDSISIDKITTHMKQEFRHKHTSVSLLNYHFVWIVRRRRRVLTGSIKQRLDVLINDACKEIDCEVLCLAIESEHVHLFLNAPPDVAPSDLMHRIKGRTARYLRQEFPELMKLPSMWTRAYFVSTAGNVSSSTIQKYIEAQGKD